MSPVCGLWCPMTRLSPQEAPAECFCFVFKSDPDISFGLALVRTPRLDVYDDQFIFEAYHSSQFQTSLSVVKLFCTGQNVKIGVKLFFFF